MIKLEDISADVSDLFLSFLDLRTANAMMQTSKFYLERIHNLSRKRKANGGPLAPHLAMPIASVLSTGDSLLFIFPDRRLVTQSAGNLRVWSPDPAGRYSSEQRVDLWGHTGWVKQVIVLPDGCLVSGSDDETLRVWSPDDAGDYSSERCVVLEDTSRVSMISQVIAISEDRLVSRSSARSLTVWSRGANGNYDSEHRVLLGGHTGLIRDMILLSDGRLVSASDDRTLRVWSPNSAGEYSSERCVVLAGHTESVHRVLVLPNGCLVSASCDHTVRVWSPDPAGHYSAERCVLLEGHSNWVTQLVALHDGRLVSSGIDGTLRVWTPDPVFGHYSSERCVVLSGHADRVTTQLAACSGGRLLSSSRSVLILDPRPARSRNTFNNHSLHFWNPDEAGEYDEKSFESVPVKALPSVIDLNGSIFFDDGKNINEVRKSLSKPLLSTTPLRDLRRSNEEEKVSVDTISVKPVKAGIGF